MRIAFAFLLASAAVSLPAHAGDRVKFDGVQEHCVKVGAIKFGVNERWASCRVTKGRWFATLDFIDMYQAQYCLGKDDEGCERRALLVFANRAYKPDAQLILQHLDAGAAQYDDPVVVQTAYGDVFTLTARLPGGAETKSFYLWHSGRWMSLESRSWLQELSKRLPKGVSVAGDIQPDLDSMSARVKLARADGSVGDIAEVELGLAKGRFAVKRVRLVSGEPATVQQASASSAPAL